MIIVRTIHTNSNKWYKPKNKLTRKLGLNSSELVSLELFDVIVVRSWCHKLLG